jgi:hypothetical protein
MKWLLRGRATLYMHINVKSIEDVLSEQQTSQEPDEEEEVKTNMKKPSLRSQHATRPLNI